jgi:glycosyltransferase involved in cell wall biosynthesis
MKVAYVVQQFPPEVGAGPARVVELAERWVRDGAEVTVITAMPSRMVPGQRAGAPAPAYRHRIFMKEKWDELNVLRSWCYSSPKGGTLRTVTNNSTFMLTALAHGLIKLPRVDVLIASSPPFFPHIAGRLLAGARSVPLVLELRDLWPDYLVGMGVIRRESRAGRALFALERSLLRAASAVVVVTESFARIVEAKGIHRDRIVVIPNGVDLDSYYPSDESPPAGRAPSKFTVGYLGNFGAGQDLSVVVRAAALLAAEDVHFVMVGDGPDRDRVERLARQAAVRNIVIRDSIPKEQTRACYHTFDVCLVPLAPIAELQSTIPSKIFEIMACGRPVLVSAGGEAARLIMESGTGMAVPPGDAETMAAAIRRLRDLSAADRRRLGLNGRAYVRRHYSRDLLASRYMGVLRRITKHHTVADAAAPAER